jgi:tetratricopeptide (TPR) repeat protein
VSRQTDFFLEQAEKAYEEGRIESAANLYRRVIEHDPDNPLALDKLASCLDQMGKHVAAYIAYETASRVADNPDQHLTRQIELAILLDRWSDAETLLARGLEKSPGDPRLLLLMAQSLYRQGHYDQAVKKFNEVLAKDDPPQEAFFLLAIVLGERQRRVDEAEAVIEKLLDAHADSATAHVFAAQWYLKQLGDRPVGDGQETPRVTALREKISQSTQAALRLGPEDRSALQVGLHHARLQRDETAVMDLAERGATRHPEEPAFYEFAAESAFRRGQPDVAAEWLERGLRKIPGDSTLLWDYIGLKLDRKQLDEAEQLLTSHKDEMTPLLRQALSGRVLVARGRWKPALDEFQAIESELTTHPHMARVIYYEQAVCYGQMRQHDRQISALRRALDVQPFWVEARESLAKALYASGRTDEAVQEFRSVVANDKFTAASGLLMARLLIAQMSRRDTESADWDAVDTFLAKLDAGGVPHEEVVRLRCAMFVAMKHLDQAEKYVRQELKESASLPASLGLALIQSERQEWDAALETIREAARKFGDSVEVRCAESL